MQLSYSDGRLIADVTGIRTVKPIGNAPCEFSADIGKEGASLLRREPANFYRAIDGEHRYTLTIDTVTDGTIAGTIRRR
jgi:hypothetical protein